MQEKTKPVFIVATANDIANMPPELLRKGRFDEIFFVDLPNEDERAQIANIHIERHGRSGAQLKPRDIASNTDGFSGAEIEQAIIEGMFNAFDEDREVTISDIIKAARGTCPLSKTMEKQIKGLREWAAGRARGAGIPMKPKTEDERPRRAVAI